MSEYKTKKGTVLPLMKLQGKDYLQVAHRLVWFREEHPDWEIETEFKILNDQVVFKAKIKDEAGQLRATAHKTSPLKNKRNPIETCETGAIGRALGMCGYGTQFCGDELSEGEEIADAPIGRDPLPVDTYRITFGKFKDMTLDEIDTEDLKQYCGYIEKKAKQDNKPIRGEVKAFLEAAKFYMG